MTTREFAYNRATMRKLAPRILALLLLLTAAPLNGRAQTPGPNGTRVAAGAVTVEVTVVAADTLRVRVAPASVLDRPERSYAVVADRPAAPRADVTDANGVVTVRGPEISARIVRNGDSPPHITVLDASGDTVVDDDPNRPFEINAATGAVSASKVHPADQMVYGFGERALPLERSSQEIVSWNTDAPAYKTGTDPIYQTVPFYIGMKNGRSYGLFFDNTWRSWFDVAKRDPDRIAFGSAGGVLDYYVFAGGRERDAHKVIGRYTELTGRSAIPPLWALGYQQCRYSYTPDTRVREIAARFRETRTPCDAIYLDIDYMDGYRVFTWNPKTFSDPAKLVGDLARDGFHTVVIIDPGIKVDDNYAVYRSLVDGGFYCNTADGKEFRGKVWPGVCAFPDFTNPGTRAWWGAQFAGLIKIGIAGFWTDMNEPATFEPDGWDGIKSMHSPVKTFPLDVRHNGDGQPGTHAEFHNVYGQQMARATMEGSRKLAPDHRPFVLTRATYAGGQRYSASWTGDNVSSWEHLELTIPMLLGMGLSGQALAGTDIGGFIGEPSAELYARWLQAAALTPVMRSHTVMDSADQEPFAYGDTWTAINRGTIELRYRLLPYLYSQFAEAARTGVPVMRPLWLDYPTDKGTYLVEDEFLVGPDLLVAPVLSPGATARGVYLPAGTRWVDWYTGTVLEGGTWVKADAPIDRLPLYVRAGAIIPTRPAAANTGAQLALPMTLLVFPGGDGECSVYEDAGDGYGPSRTTRVRNVGGKTEIVSREGSYVPPSGEFKIEPFKPR